MSPRFIVGGIAVAVIVVAAVLYGFKVRIDKQRAMKEARYVQTSATDSATSNREQIEAEQSFPGSATPQAASIAGSTLGGAATAARNELTGAIKTIAHPFPNSTQPTASTGAAAPPPNYGAGAYLPPPPSAPAVDPALEARRKEIAQYQDELRNALKGPTGISSGQSQGQAPQPSSGDPLRDEIERMNALLKKPAPAGLVTGGSNPISNPYLDGEDGYSGQNAQGQKQNFQSGGEGTQDDYLSTARVPPLSRWVVQRGDKIPATLPSKIVSDLPGDLVAQVATDVLDSPTHNFVMIPAGSKLIGEYNSNVSYGQSRVQVVWTAIYFPDGSHIDIDRMPAHAADGSAGLKDQVNNHWKRVIGAVALSSVFAAGLQISQNRTNGSVLQYPSTGQVASAAVGTQAAEVGQQITSRNMNIQPTLKIRPGEIFYISVKKDMLFGGPYQPIRFGGAR